ncbi:hypothetical protein ES705_27662 [subsurface metagenome]
MEVAIKNREQARKRAEKESMRADMKQHADKLIQGFEKLEDRHAKRAIWELFQNALDLSENCKVTIELYDSSINFSHNGKPFDSNTLSCLIKQVSSKGSEENYEEVGQYGTGFISTHSFGKKIFVSGSMQVDDYFIPLDKFEIDRVADNSEQLIIKLTKQQQRVFDLVENGEMTQERAPLTTFSYQLTTPHERKYADKSIKSLPIILPVVMTLNKKLQSVTVNEKDGRITTYKKGETSIENGLSKTVILVNNNPANVFSLCSDDDEIVVVLPLTEVETAIIPDDSLSRLFLYYPLIGTENFGFNFIIHSKRFAPTEQRNGVHLNSNNPQVQEKETLNRNLLDKASEMIFDFIQLNAEVIQHPIQLASIEFKTENSNSFMSDYFTEFRQKWVGSFKSFPLVETENGRLAPNDVFFLDKELLLDDSHYSSIYSVVKHFWEAVPIKGLAQEWTQTIIPWEDYDLQLITMENIITKIEEAGQLDFFENPEDLISFYTYLIEQGHSEFFNKHELLPNIKNEFRSFSSLHSTLNIDDVLIEVADVLIPDIPKSYIHPDFELDLGFEPYDRKQFSKDIDSQIADLNKELTAENLLPEDKLHSLIQYCNIFPSVEETSRRKQVMPIICEYYDTDSTTIHLPNIKDQKIEWLTPIKCLLRNFLLDMSHKGASWVEEKLEFIECVLEPIHNYYEYTDLVQTLPIFPNQLFEFCQQGDLKTDENEKIPDSLKDLYDDIVQPKNPIRSTLVCDGFSKFLKNKDGKTPKNVADVIDKRFQEEMSYLQINEHPYKGKILGIIETMTNDAKWKEYFPTINAEKAGILMARIEDDETKDDLFSIIGLEKSKIALLGDLSRHAELDKIIELGKRALEEQKRNDADFQFKHWIGTHIEKLIRETVGNELGDLNIRVREEQGGQDIVVESKGQVVYYIEVKSRWDQRNSIEMSPLQLKNSVNNKDNYSLCCVDMCDYKPGQPERYEVEDLSLIKDRIHVLNDIGMQVKPLMDGIMSVKDVETQITLTGDYKGTIHQTVVKEGQTMTDFVKYLIMRIGTELKQPD